MKIKSGKRILLLVVVMLFGLSSSYVFADLNAHTLDGYFSHVTNIGTSNNNVKVYRNSSVTSYGLGGAVTNAITHWGDASQKLSFTETTTEDCTGCMAIYVGSNTIANGYVGYADYWVKNWYGGWSEVSYDDVDRGSKFERARIRVDYQHMVNEGFSPNNMWKTVAHEIGHGLSLAHTHFYPAHSGEHWMTQGKIDLTAPTSTDKTHLTQKWGS